MITFCPFPEERSDRSTPEKRRVLIVDDNWFFAACLRSMIDNESDLVVCDTARSGDQLLDCIHHYRPELLVVDLTLGSQSGLALGGVLRRRAIETPILFVSSLSSPSRCDLEAIGRCGFWRKGDSPTKFLRRLRSVLSPAIPRVSKLRVNHIPPAFASIAPKT